MKKILIVLMSSMLFIAVSSLQAQAGSKQRYRWEGIAIGIGASILGNALLNYQHPYPPHPGYYPSKHWRMKRAKRVPPIHKRKYRADGYYGYNGKWVPGYRVNKNVRVRDRAYGYCR